MNSGNVCSYYRDLNQYNCTSGKKLMVLCYYLVECTIEPQNINQIFSSKSDKSASISKKATQENQKYNHANKM